MKDDNVTRRMPLDQQQSAPVNAAIRIAVAIFAVVVFMAMAGFLSRGSGQLGDFFILIAFVVWLYVVGRIDKLVRDRLENKRPPADG